MQDDHTKYCYGVTGSRDPDISVRGKIRSWLETISPKSIIYHGGCKGIDIQTAEIAFDLGYKVVAVVPASTSYLGNYLRWSHFVIYAPKGIGSENDYRARNKLLVRQVKKQDGLLKAFWNGNKRSGTYMTINIARQNNVDVSIERI